MARIELKDWPTVLDNGGETLLETMIAHRVPFPFSCAVGDCGACKGRLVSGEVEHQPCPASVLSDLERQQGLILACRCTPKGDVRLEALDELVQPPQQLRQFGRVTARDIRSGEVAVVRIGLRRKVAFLAGQYFTLKFGKLPARAYSVASVPGDDELEFHIRRVPDGLTSNHVMQAGLVGEFVEVNGPFGHGFLREKHTGPLIAIGGGTGLAPMLSIVRQALRSPSQRPMHLYYAARKREDCYWSPELAQLATEHPHLRVSITLSQQDAEDKSMAPGFRAMRVTQALREDYPSLTGTKLYVAGPPRQVHAVADVGHELGLGSRDLHTDPFSENNVRAVDGPVKSLVRTWRMRREVKHWRHMSVQSGEVSHQQ